MNKELIKATWKKLADEKKIRREDKINYCLLKALASKAETMDEKRDIAIHLLRKAFPPVSNSNKLRGGRSPFDCLFNSIYGGMNIRWKEIFGLKPEEILESHDIEMLTLLKQTIRQDHLIRNYAYFFTRQDIFAEYQLVQTAHAALELGSKIRETSPEQVKGLHFTCCGVDDLHELENVENVLKSMRVNYVVFKEPDIGNQKTAIGVYPLQEHKRGLLREHKLLRFEKVI